jgi:thiol:disulfide interchange protein DsbD
VLIGSNILVAQAPDESPVHWTAKAPAAAVRAGEIFEVKLDATLDGEWHLYSATQPPGGPIPTRFSLLTGAPFALSFAVKQTAPKTTFDQNFGIQTEFFSESAEFWVPIKVAEEAKAGNYDLTVQAVYQVCNDQMCLPPHKVPIALKVNVTAKERFAIQAKAQPSAPEQSAGVPPSGTPATVAPAAAQSTVAPPTSATPETQARDTPTGTAAEVQQARSSGFWPFLWLSMTMGAISLATPCVFPMIPITVSYFTKNAESGKGSGVAQAFVYCFGIIFTFTGLGLGLAALLGATGINQFAANPWVNLLITAVFIGFALNLFGLFQIGVPSSILTKLSNASGVGSYGQTLLMGLTFTLTSFTCTVPFVGTVLLATSQGDWLWPAMGMLGFSVVFAAPFFVLALLPRFLTALPRSGGWLNSVKVTMGFLEVAAAMKFVSNVDLVWNCHIFTREVVLAIWLAIAVLTTVYLLGKFRLPHDTPMESLGVLRMLFAMIFLAIGFYLFTGLMGGSLGELDAFLPPRTAGAFTLTGAGGPGQELSWNTSLETALAQARREQKPIFIDFTGYTCTNCRWMEANILPLPAVHTELGRFIRLQLFTDGSGKQCEDNQKYQKDKFGTIALPLYVILDPTGNKIASFPGMTRKSEEFLRFLRTPFANP